MYYNIKFLFTMKDYTDEIRENLINEINNALLSFDNNSVAEKKDVEKLKEISVSVKKEIMSLAFSETSTLFDFTKLLIAMGYNEEISNGINRLFLKLKRDHESDVFFTKFYENEKEDMEIRYINV